MEVRRAPAKAQHRIHVPSETIDHPLRHANVPRQEESDFCGDLARIRERTPFSRCGLEITAGLAQRLLPSGRLVGHEAVEDRERQAGSVALLYSIAPARRGARGKWTRSVR